MKISIEDGSSGRVCTDGVVPLKREVIHSVIWWNRGGLVLILVNVPVKVLNSRARPATMVSDGQQM